MELDYVPSYQVAHPKAFELANRLLDILPKGRHEEGQNDAFTNIFRELRLGGCRVCPENCDGLPLC